jgi:prevent-host-death family protein
MCYSCGMRSIPQRTLRNQISEVLRQVEAGERLRITVDGRPVADLVPIVSGRQTFVPHETLQQLLSNVALDANFGHDLDAVTGVTIDEL